MKYNSLKRPLPKLERVSAVFFFQVKGRGGGERRNSRLEPKLREEDESMTGKPVPDVMRAIKSPFGQPLWDHKNTKMNKFSVGHFCGKRAMGGAGKPAMAQKFFVGRSFVCGHLRK